MYELLLAATLAQVGTTPGSSPADVVEAFTQRVNEHDVEGALEMLAPDFEFRDAAGTFSIGRESTRSMLEWDAVVKARARIEILSEDDDSIEAQLTERNDFLTALGVDSLSHRVRYVVGAVTEGGGSGGSERSVTHDPAATHDRAGPHGRSGSREATRTEDGLLHRIVLLEAERVASRISAAVEPVVEWAQRERPEALAAVTHDGNPVYTGESAAAWLELLAAARNAGVITAGTRP